MPDTIFAVATSAGRAAICVVRLSGSGAGPALVTLTSEALPVARRASLRALRRPGDGEVLDRALVLWMPAPASATGEDVVELHLHGGAALVAGVLNALADLPGLRQARPGEFTRRGLLNDRLTLPEAEALADLIDAETEAQRQQAQRQMDGALEHWASQQREALLAALATAEAGIDFADEPDVAGDFASEACRGATLLLAAVRDALQSAAVSTRVREGAVVVLAGPPNAGKSTLLNALARRDVAIVSPVAGTTRDAIEVRLDLGGHLVTVVDTAGLQATLDPVEQEGVARARMRARTADLVLWLSEAGHPAPPDPAFTGLPLWRVATKTDLADASALTDHAVAATTGAGLAELEASLAVFLAGGSDGGAAGLVTRERHRAALRAAEAALAGVVAAGSAAPLEVMVEGLLEAASALDALVGHLATDDVLDAVFARFCIGK